MHLMTYPEMFALKRSPYPAFGRRG